MTTRLEMKNISIAFPGVQALSKVDFTMNAGTTHALIGANGAGKSTLMKVLAGAYGHYEGEISFDGQVAPIRTPKDAKDAGIQIVYQEVDTALIPYLSVAENIMLEKIAEGQTTGAFVNWSKLYKEAQEQLLKLNLAIPVKKRVSELTLAEKQLVLIARATATDCKFLILDEPTAPLSEVEATRLFKLVDQLKQEGVGIIFISHRLPELFQICENITILRDGKHVITTKIEQMTMVEVATHMLGMSMGEQYPKRLNKPADVILEANRISDQHKVKDVSFQLKRGEIVGIAGLVGAGKTELCRLLFGATKLASGTLTYKGQTVKFKTPYDAVKRGFAMIPEERRREGIFVEEQVATNLSISNLRPYVSMKLWLSRRSERAAANSIINRLSIKTPNERAVVQHLSGGNQQKIAIGKWLLSDAEVYIFDEPTKGVDVGAKKDIYDIIAKLTESGKSVIFASSETNEVMGISDRIYVMYDGKIAQELQTERTSEQEIMYYSTGGQ